MLRIPCFHPDPVCALSHSVVSNSWQPHGLYPSRPLRPWGLSRPKHWSGLPCPPSGDLSNPGIEPRFPHCSRILYLLSYQGFIQATKVQFPGRELTSRFTLPLTASHSDAGSPARSTPEEDVKQRCSSALSPQNPYFIHQCPFIVVYLGPEELHEHLC